MRRRVHVGIVAATLFVATTGRAGPAAPARADGVLAGRVVDGAGREVGGVHVVAEPGAVRTRFRRAEGPETLLLALALEVPSASPAAPAATTTSGPDGTWRLDGLDPAARYLVRATHGQLASDPTLHVPADPWAPVTLTLRPDVVAAVRVVDAQDRPVVGATVTVEDRPAEWWGSDVVLARARTDAAGRATLRGLRTGRPDLVVSSPGRGSLHGFAVDVPTEGERVVRMGDPAGGRYEGTVRDMAGAPIAGARVVVASRRANVGEEHPATALVTTTDAAGAFRVEAVPPGSMVGVGVVAKGFVRVLGVDARRRVVAGGVMQADLVLAPAGSVTGTVHATDGASAVGVTVEAGGVTAVTDGAGRYRLDGLAPGTHELRVRAADGVLPSSPADGIWEVAGGWWVAVRANVTTSAPTLELEPGVRVAGRVVDAAGTPVAGAYVRAVGEHGGVHGLERETTAAAARSDEDGRFMFDGLRPGREWSFSASTDRAATDPAPDAALRASPRAVPVELVVFPVGRLAGVVVDRAGARLASVGVELARPVMRTGTSDAEGRFAFERLSAGRYVVEPTYAQRRHRRKPAAVRTLARGEDARDVVLTTERPGAVAGVVVDETGAPAVGVSVALKAHEPWVFTDRWGTEENWWNWATTTDGHGRFRFEDLAPGGYEIRPARTDGDGDVEVGDHDVRLRWYRDRLPEADGPEVDRLNRWAFTGTRLPIEVRVVAPDGAPVAAGWVRVTVHHGGDGSGYASHGAEIRFGWARTTVPSDGGKIDVEVERVEDAAGAPYDVAPAKQAGLKAAPATLEFRLVAAPLARGPVAGRVVDEDGRAIPGTLVVAYAPKADAFPSALRERNLADVARTATAADGSFRFDGLAPDVSLVRVVGPADLRPAEADVRVGMLDVVLRPLRAATVEGRVTDAAGRGIAAASVEAGGARAATSFDGSFVAAFDPEVEAVEVKVLALAVPGRPGLAYGKATRAGVVRGTRDLVIVLPEVATVTGSVVGTDGKQIRDAKLVLEPDPPVTGREPIRGEQAWHSDDGFALEDVPPGRYRLTATDEQGLRTSAPVLLSAPATDVRIVLGGEPSVRGRVVGSGAAGCRVAVVTEDPTGPAVVVGFADARGAFAVPVRADGPFTVFVRASSDDDRFATRSGVARDADLGDVALDEGAGLAGRVTGATVSDPAKAAVWARARDGLLLPGTVDGGGRWRVRGLPPDSRWDVVVCVADGTSMLVGETKGVRAGADDVEVAVARR